MLYTVYDTKGSNPTQCLRHNADLNRSLSRDQWQGASTTRPVLTNASALANSGNVTGSKRLAPFVRLCTISKKARSRPCLVSRKATGSALKRPTETSAIPRHLRGGEDWPRWETKQIDSCLQRYETKEYNRKYRLKHVTDFNPLLCSKRLSWRPSRERET
jgi:hypothetical protein